MQAPDIIFARARLNVDRAGLAEMLGLKPATVRAYEMGYRRVSKSVAILLGKLLAEQAGYEGCVEAIRVADALQQQAVARIHASEG